MFFSLNRVARNPWKNPSVAWSMYKKALDRKFRSNKSEQGIALRKPNNSKLLLMDILHNTFKAWKQSANLNCFSLLCIVKRESIFMMFINLQWSILRVNLVTKENYFNSYIFPPIEWVPPFRGMHRSFSESCGTSAYNPWEG